MNKIALLAATAFLTLASQAHAGQGRIPQQEAMCSRDSSFTWCQAQPTQERQTANILETIRSIEADVRSRFTYALEDGDVWSAYPNATQAWSGDCEDLVMTILEQASQAGVPNEKMWRALVFVNSTKGQPAKTKGRRFANHYVGIVQDERGEFWVVGDTSNGKPFLLRAARFQIMAVSRMDESGWSNVYEESAPTAMRRLTSNAD